MKRIDQKTRHISKGQQGMALFAALVVMIMLTVLGMAGIYLATTDIMISHNYKQIRQKFFTAEAALQQGINTLKTTGVNDWSDFITGADQSTPAITIPSLKDVDFHGMTFRVRVQNNLDDPVFTDPNYTSTQWYSTDLDKILVVIAEGMGSRGEPKVIESAVQWEPKPVHSYGGKDMTADNANVTTGNIDWTS